MKIISWNVNGIRSAYKKGLLDFINKEMPDIVCLQEIKARKEDLHQELLGVKNYHSFFNPAEKKGYSGVAVFTKVKPISVNAKLNLQRFDKEGRLLELEYSNFILLNLYLPHGGRQKENLDYKLEAYRKLLRKIKGTKNKSIVLIGDFNVAHNENDLARPEQNKDNIMFTLKERAQIDAILKFGFIDCFRSFNSKSGYYTWWPYAFKARERNLGWRIDYGFVSKDVFKMLDKALIYSNIFCSDHCPIGLVLNNDGKL